MHMADALLSPQVGLSFCAASGAAIAYSASKLEGAPDQKRVPLMGVLGAFVFAGQMINFTIPGTGSSGHLIGGVLLATLLGGHAALITITSVLMIQSLLFADGGILALGTNVFNMGVYPCLLGGFLVRSLAGPEPGGKRLGLAIIFASLVCLELGALSVAVETVLSGKTDLPFGQFAALMLLIHLPIALAEGAVTWAVVRLVYRLQPGLRAALHPRAAGGARLSSQRKAVVVVGASALLLSAIGGLVASTNPDGLEWAVQKLAGMAPAAFSSAPRQGATAELQEKTALLAGYQLPSRTRSRGPARGRGGTSAAGLIGGLISLALCSLAGILASTWRRRKRIKQTRTPS